MHADLPTARSASGSDGESPLAPGTIRVILVDDHPLVGVDEPLQVVHPRVEVEQAQPSPHRTEACAVLATRLSDEAHAAVLIDAGAKA